MRQVFGLTVIAGSVTTAFIFFAGEHAWRRRLPFFFPEGDLRAVPRVPRLAVRTRLLAIFLLIGVIPPAILGMLSYMRALGLEGADPAAAAEIVDGLRVTIVFLVGVGIAPRRALDLRGQQRGGAAAARGGRDGRGGAGRARRPRPRREHRRDRRGGRGLQPHAARAARARDGQGDVRQVRHARDPRRDPRRARARRGQLIEATMLFADLRDFTPWVEATEPREVVRDLNEYFTEMDRAIRAHGGLVLQFIGDEIEAVFGAPIAARRPRRPRGARRDRDARAAPGWNARREAAGRTPLRNGIGIHTGTVLAGNIGGAERLSYALVGDPVNLASRIQGLTKDFKVDILISDATRSRLDGAMPSRSSPRCASRAAWKR